MLRLFISLIFTLSFAVPSCTGLESTGFEEAGYVNDINDAEEQSYVSKTSLTKFLFLERVGQNFSAPCSSLKDAPIGYLSLYALELKLQSIAGQYLLRLGATTHGLTIKEIIFPFQYFW